MPLFRCRERWGNPEYIIVPVYGLQESNLARSCARTWRINGKKEKTESSTESF